MSGGNPPARTWSLAYDGSNRLSSLTDPKNGVTRYAWTTYTRSDGKVLPLISTITSPNGNLILTAHYDSSGRITSAVTPDGTTSFGYSAGIGSNGTTTVTDPLGHARSWSYTWPAAPTGETAKFGYFLTSATDALGRQTQFAATHSGSNLVTQITDYRGRLTAQSWDYTMGNLLSRTTPTATGGTATASWTYASAFNQVSSATDDLGRKSTATIDPATGNTTQTTDARNYSTNYTYNSTGDCATTTNALNQERLLYYDFYGDLDEVSDGTNVLYLAAFDQAGRKLSETDATGKVTQYLWDSLDRLTAVTKTHNGQAVTTSFTFDADSNRIKLTDPNSHVWQWSVDAMDRVVSATNPVSQTVTQSFDAGGNLQVRTDSLGQQSVFSYDPENRISGATYKRADGSTESTVSYSYDSTTHLLTSVTDSLFGTTSWSYDSLDRAISESGPNGTLSFTLNAAINRREGLTVSGQGAVSYGFDNNDNQTSIVQGGLTTSTSFDALNRPSQRTLPSGLYTQWGYDTHGYTSTIRSWQGTTCFDNHSYIRDLEGNILQESVNGATWTYSLDDLYRLSSANVLGNSYSWSYDLAGNRLSQTVNGATTSYTYNNADQLLTVNGVSVATDADGNVTADEIGGLYSWDVRGRLSALTRNGVTSQFGYNQDGLRVSKTVNGTTTAYLLDGDDVVQENAGGTTTNLLQGPGTDNLIERGSQWYLPSSLGSTSTLVDGSGNIQQRYYYQPFGQASIQGSGSASPYQFTGREADESGLMYYRARYYNPSWGRYVSVDPDWMPSGPGAGRIASNASDVNPYVYCANNPASLFDSSGDMEVPAWVQGYVRLFQFLHALWFPNPAAPQNQVGLPSQNPGYTTNYGEPTDPGEEAPEGTPMFPNYDTPIKIRLQPGPGAGAPPGEPPPGAGTPPPASEPGTPGSGVSPGVRLSEGGYSRATGSGAALGAFFTIYQGLDALTQGLRPVVSWRLRIGQHLNGNGYWGD